MTKQVTSLENIRNNEYVDPTDEALMTAYAASDGGAFQALYERWKPKLQAFIQFRVRDASRRDDVFQLTWLKIHQNRKSFEPSRRFRPWAYTICLNVIRDLLREKQASTAGDELEAVADTEKTPEAQILHREQWDQIQHALETLSAPDRELLWLSDYEGLSTEEIQHIVNAPGLDALRKRISRSRQLARKVLKNV